MIKEIIGSTEKVIDAVTKLLPDNFPMDLAEDIFNGMKKQGARLSQAQ